MSEQDYGSVVASSLLLLTAICHAVIAAVMASGSRRPGDAEAGSAQRIGAFVAGTLSLWAICVQQVCIQDVQGGVVTGAASLWSRGEIAVSVLAILGLVAFARTFPSGHRLSDDAPFLAFLLPTPMLLYLATTPFAQAGLPSTTSLSTFGAEHSVLSILRYVFLLAGLTAAVVTLLTRWRLRRGRNRLRVQYILLGVLVTAGLGAVLAAMGALSPRGSFQPVEPVVTLPLSFAIVYATERIRLPDFAQVVNTGFATALIILVIACSAVAGASITSPPESLAPALSSALLVSLAVGLCVAPLRRSITSALGRRLFPRRTDYRGLVAWLNRTITPAVELEPLLDNLLDTLCRGLGVEWGAVLLRAQDDSYFVASAFGRSATSLSSIQAESELALLLRESPDVLLRDELSRRFEERRAETLRGHLMSLGCDAAVPLSVSDHPAGVMLLGPKANGAAYTHEDVMLFSALSNRAAAAVETAGMYRALLIEKRHKEHLLAQMDSGVIAVDADGRISDLNAEARRICCGERESGFGLIGEPLDVLPGDIAALLQQTLSSGEAMPRRRWTLDRSETLDPMPITASTTLLLDDYDEPAGAVLVCNDESALQAMQEEVRRSERLASIGTLAAGLAHEIRNPLLAIRSMTEIMCECYYDADYRRSFVDLVPREVDRINGLVCELLDLANPTPLERRSVRVRRLCEETLQLVSARAERYGVRCELHVHAEVQAQPVIMGDADRLKQVLYNLLLNALQAIKEHGASYGDPEVMLHLALDAADSETSGVRIEVRDNGPGMDAETAQQVFDPFFTTKKSGHGLGLAISHNIVKDHEGSLSVDSKAGRGTTFAMLLPCVPHELTGPVPTRVDIAEEQSALHQ